MVAYLDEFYRSFKRPILLPHYAKGDRLCFSFNWPTKGMKSGARINV